MSLPYKANLIPKAKTLRKNATPQENHLWYDFLKSFPIRFQRQKSIGNYIVDFYCHEANLVVEIDGSQHYDENETHRDHLRTKELEKFGLVVLRYSNRDINTQFWSVCESIQYEVEARVGREIVFE